MTTQIKYIQLQRYLLLALGMLLLNSPAFTQKSTDSLIINAGKSKIIFLINDAQDLERLKTYDLNALLEQLSQKVQGDSSGQITAQQEPQTVTRDTSVIKEDSIALDNPSEHDKVPMADKKRGTRHFFNLEVGTNNFLKSGKFPSESNEPYAVRPFGSWYFAVSSLYQTRLSQSFYFEWGPSLSWYNFKFQNDRLRVNDGAEMTTFMEDAEFPEADFKKSKLTVAYLNVSAVPMFKTRGGFRIGAGGYGGYKIDSYTKIVYKADGKEKQRNHDDFHLNNFRYGLRLQLGYRGTDFFFNYDLNELFNENQGPKLNAFSFGLIF